MAISDVQDRDSRVVTGFDVTHGDTNVEKITQSAEHSSIDCDCSSLVAAFPSYLHASTLCQGFCRIEARILGFVAELDF